MLLGDHINLENDSAAFTLDKKGKKKKKKLKKSKFKKISNDKTLV